MSVKLTLNLDYLFVFSWESGIVRVGDEKYFLIAEQPQIGRQKWSAKVSKQEKSKNLSLAHNNNNNNAHDKL